MYLTYLIYYQTPTLELQNTGEDCWHHCDSKQGPCSWCGTRGMCCKNGWHDISNGCDGTFGGISMHECVLKEGILRGSLFD